MSKFEKQTNGVFIDIVGTSEKNSSYDIFLKSGPQTPSKDLIKYTEIYRNLVEENKTTLKEMALLEEVIIQLRCKENISKIKLSVLRGEYIYAIAPFFRVGSSGKDIRVLVDKTEFQGDDIKKLYMDKKFMELCEKKIIESMDNFIKSNKRLLQSFLV